jgi:hypothetical protein
VPSGSWLSFFPVAKEEEEDAERAVYLISTSNAQY